MSAPKQKILIVDDEPDMRKVIDDILTQAGYETFLAENGAHALELAAAVMPDLILSDIQMPSVNGYELLNKVKVDPQMGKIPFVFMTGVNVGRYDMRKGMDLGADDYLTKPFSVEDLLTAVEIRLRKQQLWHAFTEAKLTSTQTGFIVLLSNELHLLVMDILEHAQSLLAGQEIAAQDVERAAQMIARSGKRLGRLHENILYYSMLQIWVKDDATIAAMRTESAGSVLNILHSVLLENPRIKSRIADITVQCHDAAVQLSPADLGKVLDEVVDNACRFSESGTPITIAGSVRDGSLVLTVTDAGRGMTADEIARSASLFRSGSEPRRAESGIGLTIAATIAELYGGGLSVISALRKGTTVTVMLPTHRS